MVAVAAYVPANVLARQWFYVAVVGFIGSPDEHHVAQVASSGICP